MSVFSGLSAFPITPMDEQGIVDCDLLGKLVERLVATDVNSIGVLGSTGSYMYLSMQERKRALEAAMEAAGNVPVVAGIGAMCTSDVCNYINHAEQLGVSGALLAPVSYLPLTDKDVASLFDDVSASSALPICFYNNPGTTHFSLSESLLVQLAQKKVISSVKNPPPVDLDFAGQLKRLTAEVPTDFSLGYSGDAKIAAALRAGCDAWYSVVGGTLPDLAVKLWCVREDDSKLLELDDALRPLWSTFNSYGGIRVIYEVVRMLGFGTVRLPKPLLPLSVTACEEIESALCSIKLLDEPIS